MLLLDNFKEPCMHDKPEELILSVYFFILQDQW
jgi:hypothetical protein